MPKHFITMRLDADLLRAIDTAAGPRGRTRWLEDAAHDKIENDAIRAAPKSPTGGAILAGAPRPSERSASAEVVPVLKCTHPKWYADSTGKNRCVDCKTPKH